MKSHVKLFTTVLREAGQDCGVSTLKDKNSVLFRLSNEGESFLTISLPSYEKSLLSALDMGRVTSDHFHGFRRSGGLPTLFRGFLRKMFDDHGEIRPTSGEFVRALRRLRQVLLVLSKIELDCSPEREKAVLDQYIETDEEIQSYIPFISENGRVHDTDWYIFQESFELLFSEYLDDVERAIMFDPTFRGNHGPGAVAGRELNNARWSLNTWTDRLESILPAESTLSCNLHDYMDQNFSWLPQDQEPPVRVVTVPKTMKGPRVIAVEPAHMQYVQQGLFKLMTRVLLEDRHSTLNSRMGWTDQEPNRWLSKDHVNYSTIDLSEASDRVPLALVDFVFSTRPNLHAVLMNSRSERAELADGRNVRLNKFASMGSAMCFPVESMIFAACIMHAARVDPEGGVRMSPYFTTKRRLGMMPAWRVFGDDMVVPKTMTPTLISVLEAFGLKVNINKSFWTGKFRESCGADWYDGHNVSIVKVRSAFPIERSDTHAYIRGVSLHNRLMEAGMFESAHLVESELIKSRPALYAPMGTDVIALWTYDESKVDWKFNRSTQQPQLRAYKPSFKYRLDELDGYGALRKYFAKADEWSSPWEDDRDGHLLKREYPTADPEHLRYSGRPLRVTINAGYVSL